MRWLAVRTSAVTETVEPKRRGRSSKVSRERILDAALVEFAENGYEGATTASVARRVGVTQPLIHYHFGSKEALWRSAVELAVERMQAVLAAASTEIDGDAPHAAIRAMARRFIYFNAEYPVVGRLMIAEAATPGPRLEWMAERHVAPMFRKMEALFDMGQKSGLVKNLPLTSIMFAFLGAVPHLFDCAPLVRLLYDIDPLEPQQVDRHVDALIEIFARGLLTDPDALE
jgi:TetR/AcrR family transcriptional regulator